MSTSTMHVEVLEGRSMASGLWRRIPVVWLDRESATCPRCGEPIPADPGCPVVFDVSPWEGGTSPIEQTHGCGEWLTVDHLVGVDGEDPAELVARARVQLAHETEIPPHG